MSTSQKSRSSARAIQPDEPGGTTFAVGFDLLPNKHINAESLLATIQQNPANTTDILIAGLTEITETMPAKEAIQQIRTALHGAAILAG